MSDTADGLSAPVIGANKSYRNVADAEVLSAPGVVSHRSSRVKVKNVTLDKESVDIERLVQLRRVRGGHAAYVTRVFRSFTESLEAGDIAETAAQLDAYAGAVSTFKIAHDKYMSLATVCDPGKLTYLEDHYLEVIAQLKMAQVQFDKLKVDMLSRPGSIDIKPEDSVSQQGSYSSIGSTSSARAKVAAKKAALQAKVLYLKRQQELEYEQMQSQMRQTEAGMEIKRLEMEGELHAAAEEERVLTEFMDEKSVSRSGRRLPRRDVTKSSNIRNSGVEGLLKVSVSAFDKHNRFGGVSDSRLVSGDNTDARMKGAAKVSVSEFDKHNRFGGVSDSRLVSDRSSAKV